MIKSFKCKATEQLFSDRQVKRFGSITNRARAKLEILNASVSLDSLKIPPGNQLELLTGDRSGQRSIRINRQWRICFVWVDGDAFDVEITDYH